jgi:hypothetical protein
MDRNHHPLHFETQNSYINYTSPAVLGYVMYASTL